MYSHRWVASSEQRNQLIFGRTFQRSHSLSGRCFSLGAKVQVSRKRRNGAILPWKYFKITDLYLFRHVFIYFFINYLYFLYKEKGQLHFKRSNSNTFRINISSSIMTGYLCLQATEQYLIKWRCVYYVMLLIHYNSLIIQIIPNTVYNTYIIVTTITKEYGVIWSPLHGPGDSNREFILWE